MEAMTEEGSDSQPPSNSWWHKSAFTKVSGYKDENVPISSINTSSFTINSHRPLQPSPVAHRYPISQTVLSHYYGHVPHWNQFH